MAAVAGPSKADVAWLAECERRLKRWLKLTGCSCFVCNENRQLLRRCVLSAYRDFVDLQQGNRARFLIESERQRKAGVWGPQP